MKWPAIVVAAAFFVSVAAGAIPARAADGGCATSAAKLVEPPKITLPETNKMTSKWIGLEADIGSDGRVRGLQIVRSSGDPTVDLQFRQALQAATYLPPQTGCVAYSGGLALNYSLAPDAGSFPPPPAALVATCTPYLSAFLIPSPRDRKRTGTAVVVIDLDASGTRTGTPALRKSTGSSVLDAEALRIAATGHYSFLRTSPCAPQSFSYSLELTFQ